MAERENKYTEQTETQPATLRHQNLLYQKWFWYLNDLARVCKTLGNMIKAELNSAKQL